MRLDAIRESTKTQAGRADAPLKTGSTAFEQALQQAVSTPKAAGLDFSKHAMQRLEQRGIRLNEELLGRLEDGVAKAAAKGAQTTLVLVDKTAFVVGVPSRTVVTVADQEHLKERVFTNIDSMVIA